MVLPFYNHHYPDLIINKLKYFFLLLFKVITSELFIWTASLIFLALFNNPYKTHFTICPLNNLGIDYCPGCGLGNSISYLFYGDINNSIAAHPFGIPAIIILTGRIFSLMKQEGSKYAKRVTINA